MSAVVINLNPDLKRLQDEGYELDVREGCAIIHGIPYLDSNRSIQHGILVSPLNMSGDTVNYNGDHTIFFQGSIPYRSNGERLDAVFNSLQNASFAGVSIDMMFSNKPSGGYQNYYDKFTRYIHILSAEAQAVDAAAIAETFKKVVSSDEGVFNYADTNASRGGIMDVTDKLKQHKIGIIGLGGTGAYILDQIAKTPVAEIHLFDGDFFCQHNAFRAPGAPCVDVFGQQPYKADYFKSIYGNMHRHILSHPYYLDEDNVEELGSLDFVFIAMDSGNCKQVIIDFLRTHSISFIDTGIGIVRTEVSLIGTTRSTLSIQGNTQTADLHISYAEADKDLYQSNIQTADLNAFCALSAVIQWKKHLEFYRDDTHLDNSVYHTNDGEFKWD